MNFEIVLFELFVVSTLTGLTTEAIKTLLNEMEKDYKTNVVAGISALVLSLAVNIGYAIINNVTMDAGFVVYTVALVFLSWLAAMVGYDKVIQTITQIGKEN